LLAVTVFKDTNLYAYQNICVTFQCEQKSIISTVQFSGEYKNLKSKAKLRFLSEIY